MPSILIVDDEPDSSLFVAKFLEKHGYQTKLARHGEEALSVLLHSHPDAVILDIRMPVMDGITLLQIMRSYLRWASVPVVVLSANASQYELDKARNLGACSILRKSQFKLNDLLVCLPKPSGQPGNGMGGMGAA